MTGSKNFKPFLPLIILKIEGGFFVVFLNFI